VPIAREIFKKYFNIYDETDKIENKDIKQQDIKQKTIKENL